MTLSQLAHQTCWNVQKSCELYAELSVLVETEKMASPTMCLTFLGIEVDTDQLEIHLLQDKLLRIKQMISNWMGWKVVRRRELESFLGLLQHAAKVVSPGRRFVRRIIQALTGVKKRNNYVRLGLRYAQTYYGCTGCWINGTVWEFFHPRIGNCSYPIGCIWIMGLCSCLG